MASNLALGGGFVECFQDPEANIAVECPQSSSVFPPEGYAHYSFYLAHGSDSDVQGVCRDTSDV
eukprot:1351782-Amorphochlora_amoeboformis.AAC.1